MIELGKEEEQRIRDLYESKKELGAHLRSEGRNNLVDQSLEEKGLAKGMKAAHGEYFTVTEEGIKYVESNPPAD